MDSSPKATAPIQLTICPLGLETYTDFQRGKQIVRLSYRRRDVTQRQDQDFVADVLADVTRAGLIVTAPIEHLISLDNAKGKDRALQSPRTRCTCNLKIQVQPEQESVSGTAEWVAQIKAQYAGGEKVGEGD